MSTRAIIYTTDRRLSAERAHAVNSAYAVLVADARRARRDDRLIARRRAEQARALITAFGQRLPRRLEY